MARRSPFNGWYGNVYNRSMSSATGRRAAAFTIWGGGTALTNLPASMLEAVQGAMSSAEPDGRPPLVLDVPCGGGSLWPMLERAGFRGDVIGIDIAAPMLARAKRRAARLRASGSPVAARTMHGDALDLPLDNDSVDGAISINGLHCFVDPARFLRELERVLRPGADAWIVTMVEPTRARERRAVDAAIRMGVLPQVPPSRADIQRLAQVAGFSSVEDRGERGVVTFRLTNPG